VAARHSMGSCLTISSVVVDDSAWGFVYAAMACHRLIAIVAFGFAWNACGKHTPLDLGWTPLIIEMFNFPGQKTASRFS
jgi:hypothetical protein